MTFMTYKWSQLEDKVLMFPKFEWIHVQRVGWNTGKGVFSGWKEFIDSHV